MKSFTRSCFIFSGVVISIGLVLTLIGAVLGAGSTFTEMLVNGRFYLGGTNNSTIVGGKNLTESYDEFQDVEELNIDLKYGELIINESDSDNYVVKAEDVLTGYTCVNENGKLTIKDNIKSEWRIGVGNDYHPIINLYIPKDVSLDKIKIDIGAGSVSVSSMKSDKLSIDIGAGKFEADNISADESEIDVGAGSLLINQLVTDEITLNCGTGKLEINGMINGDADLECGLGNITLSLSNEESDFNYDIDCGIGNITLANQSIGGIATKKSINNKADANMDIECGVGNIEINFNETL